MPTTNYISLNDGFEAHPGRFLFHRPTCTVIFSDVHLGVEKSLRAQGIDFPDRNLLQLMKKCERIVTLMRDALPAGARGRLIIAGDFLDDRAQKNDALAAWEQARAFLNVFCDVADITLIPGNHDPSLTKLRDALQQCTTIEPHTEVGGYTVIHGDGSLDRFPDLHHRTHFIAGHLHPVVVLGDRVRSAKMPVFLRCRLRERAEGQTLLVLPTFSRMPIGTNVAVERYWFLPFARPIESDIDVYGVVEPTASDARVLSYGTLASLREAMVLG